MNKKVEKKSRLNLNKLPIERMRKLARDHYPKEQLDAAIVTTLENQNKILFVLGVFAVGALFGVAVARRKRE